MVVDYEHCQKMPKILKEFQERYGSDIDVGMFLSPKYGIDHGLYSELSKNSFVKTLSIITGMTEENMFWHYSHHPKISSVFSENTFFGFNSATELVLYTMVIYLVKRFHPSDEYKARIESELSDIGSVFTVKYRYELMPLDKFLHEFGYKVYDSVLVDFICSVVSEYHEDIKSTATDAIDSFRKIITDQKNCCTVLLDFNYSTYVDIFHDTYYLTDSIRKVNEKTLENVLNDESKINNRFFSEYMIYRMSGVCEDNESTFANCSFDHNDGFEIPCVQFLGVVVNKCDNHDSLTFQSTYSDVRDLYDGFVKHIPISTSILKGRVILDPIGFSNKTAEVRSWGKQLRINTSCANTIVSGKESDSFNFKLCAYYNTKNIESTKKVIKFISEIDPSATISNVQGFSKVNPKMVSIESYCTKMSEKLKREKVPNDDNMYMKFLQECRTGKRGQFRLRYTKVIQYYANGLIDDYILDVIINRSLSADRFTVSLSCNDLRRLRKLKLLGIVVDNLKYKISDADYVMKHLQFMATT